MRNLPEKVRRELDAKEEAEARSNKPKPTNADRIRAMSDEELAQFIPNWSYTKACKCDEQRFVDCNNECEKCVADWLQQPAPEEGEQHV